MWELAPQFDLHVLQILGDIASLPSTAGRKSRHKSINHPPRQQRFTGQAPRHQQAGQLGQVTAHRVGQ